MPSLVKRQKVQSLGKLTGYRLFFATLTLIIGVIFSLVINYPDFYSGMLFIFCLVLLFDIAFYAIFSRENSLFLLIFAFYHIFLFIIPGMIHISVNRFPFYGLSYSIDETRTVAVLLTLFSGFFYLGVMFFAARVADRRRRVNAPQRAYNLKLLLFSALGLLLLTMLLAQMFGLEFFLSRRAGEGASLVDKTTATNQILINIIRFGSFVAAMTVWLVFRQHKSWILLMLAITISGVALIFNWPIAIPRFYLFGYLLAILYVFFDFKSSFRKCILFVTMSASLLLLFPLASILSRGDISQIDRFDPVRYYTENGDFDGMQSTHNVVRYVNRHGPAMGNQLLGSLLTFVPRSAWSEKPVSTGGLVAANAGYRFLNISSPLAAELYIDFWYLGVVPLSFLLGMLASWIDRKAAWLGSRTDIVLPLILGLAIGFETIVLRGSLMAAVAPVALVFLFAFLMRAFSSRSIRRSGYYARPHLPTSRHSANIHFGNLPREQS